MLGRNSSTTYCKTPAVAETAPSASTAPQHKSKTTEVTETAPIALRTASQPQNSSINTERALPVRETAPSA